ncbi:protein RER1 [Leptopilina boulardi]|uniref:protein RER1 n=1 Tax=Leptopilina boulardi TaxID=63433 RepID=UPI0021F61645|nr:protein RER1 [Leptopilina boulardi]
MQYNLVIRFIDVVTCNKFLTKKKEVNFIVNQYSVDKETLVTNSLDFYFKKSPTMMYDEDLDGSSGRNVISQKMFRMSQFYQSWLDRCAPHVIWRWVFAVALIIIFLIRILVVQGWYIITYGLGIYHLNLFIAFLTPKIDPAMDFDDSDGPELPTKSNEEFRPFIRRLPEFKFWHAVTISTISATILTFFDMFNIPVFWPILVMYFITLFCITMKRQIKHMLKYRYLPFTHGKPRYQNHEDTTRLMK